MTDTTSLQHEPVGIPERSFGRTVRSVLGYALLVALMIVSPLFRLPLFIFVPAALFACAARNSRLAATIMLALATTITVFVVVQAAHVPGTPANEGMMMIAYVLAFVTGVCVPALVVMPQVERGEPFGRVLLTAVMAGIPGLAATEAVMQAGYGFSPYREQVARANQMVALIIDAYQKASIPADKIAVMSHWFKIGVSLVPSYFLIDIIVVFVLSLVMFGRLKAWREFVMKRGGERAQTYLFRNFSLPDWLLFAFVIGGITPLMSGMLQKVTANILAVVAFLYLLQGLAIFRSLLVAVGAGFTGVMFGYFILGLLTITGIAPFLLSIAGLFDSFFDFRHFRRKDHSDESHPH